MVEGRRRAWAQRGQTFIALGCILGWPATRELACSLSMGGGLFLATGGGVPDDPLRTTWSSLRGRDPVALERDLRASYRRLFESPGAERVELIESRFPVALGAPRRPSARFTAERLQALEADYAAAGFQPACAALAADHVTVELHFLGHLLDRASGAAPEAKRAAMQARRFLREHLMNWLPALRAVVAARHECGFYAAVLAAAEACARAVQAELHQALDEAEQPDRAPLPRSGRHAASRPSQTSTRQHADSNPGPGTPGGSGPGRGAKVRAD